MTIDVFGDRVDHNVRAVVERILDVRTQEGIVNHDHDAVTVRHRSDIADIDQPESRVAGALDPDQLRLLRADELGDVELDAGRERHLDAVGSGHFGEIAVRAAIDVRNRHHMRARGKGLQDQRCGGGTGGEGEGKSGMLERGDGLLEVVSAERFNKSNGAAKGKS